MSTLRLVRAGQDLTSHWPDEKLEHYIQRRALVEAGDAEEAGEALVDLAEVALSLLAERRRHREILGDLARKVEGLEVLLRGLHPEGNGHEVGGSAGPATSKARGGSAPGQASGLPADLTPDKLAAVDLSINEIRDVRDRGEHIAGELRTSRQAIAAFLRGFADGLGIGS